MANHTILEAFLTWHHFAFDSAYLKMVKTIEKPLWSLEQKNNLKCTISENSNILNRRPSKNMLSPVTNQD